MKEQRQAVREGAQVPVAAGGCVELLRGHQPVVADELEEDHVLARHVHHDVAARLEPPAAVFTTDASGGKPLGGGVRD